MRISLFIMLVLASVSHIWLLVIPLSIVYAFRFSSYELIVIAVLIDGYTGQFFAIPYLSIFTALAALTVEWARPVILSYT